MVVNLARMRLLGHIAAGLCVGAIAGSVVALLQVAALKVAIPLVLATVFVAVVAATRQPERWCTWAFLLAVPLPMHAFLLRLEPAHGGGALGIYLVAADLPLLLLYAFWFIDWIRGGRSPANRPHTLLLLLVPFLLVGTLSIAYSPKPLWALAEVVRWLKFGAVLYYVSKRLPEEALPGCVWAIALSIVIESTLGAAQTATQSNLGLDKLGLFGAAGEQAVTQDLGASQTLFRGSALTGHPNYLAGYLLLVAPIFMLLAMNARSVLERWAAAAVFLAATAGLMSTMSRAAWVALAGAAAVAYLSGAVLKMLTVRRALTILLIVVACGAVATVSFSDLILKRFRSDFSESWQLRVDLNDAALRIATDNPLFGVGLNNYTVVYPAYDPAFARQMDDMDGMLTVVHNLFLLLLAEVGFVGLVAYLAMFAGTLVVVARAMPTMPGRHRPIAVGIICGILGALAFDLSEISLWMDGSMYTLAFLMGMLTIVVAASRKVHPVMHVTSRQVA